MLADNSQLSRLKKRVAERGLIISAISVHGNPLHPDERIAGSHHNDFHRACDVAAKFEVPTVIAMSGCPGSDPKAELPSWVVSPQPMEDFYRSWEWQWQWNEKVIPYWRDASNTARRTVRRDMRDLLFPNGGVLRMSKCCRLEIRSRISRLVGVQRAERNESAHGQPAFARCKT